MTRTRTLIGVWICIAEVLGGCGHPGRDAAIYPRVLLQETLDPLVQDKPLTPWRPPRQMAAFIHPHEDAGQGILIGGHWILLLLGDGSWYVQDEESGDPLPDQDATPEELRRALGALQVPRDAVVPYRMKGEKP